MTRNHDFKTLTGAETAKLLGVEVRTFQRMVGRGEFPGPILVSKSRKWLMKDVNAFIWLQARFSGGTPGATSCDVTDEEEEKRPGRKAGP